VCGGGGGGEGWRGRRPWCSELSMRGECMLWGVYGGGGEGWRWRGGVGVEVEGRCRVVGGWEV